MEIINTKQKPSKRLTAKISEWYETEQQRKEAAQAMRSYESAKEGLTGKILEYIDQGFTPQPNSEYGVAVIEQSSRVAYEKLYKGLVNALCEKYPQYANKIQEVGTNLERKAQQELELKRTVVCDENEQLEKLVKRAEKAELEDRKTTKNIQLVIYT
ncbi:hypothetical protein JXB28_00940 [Candidatus Woesearchaeota archaeon]|nr:hypothetical protein [Candidatus Woesearchaeota archaeon]